MTAVTFEGEQSSGCWALRNGSDAEELRRTASLHDPLSSLPLQLALYRCWTQPHQPLPGPSVTVEDFDCDGLTLIMAY